MNPTETDLVRRIMLALGKFPGVRVFRNNTGTGWQSNQVYNVQRAMQVNVNKGDVILKQGRIVHFGLCKGSSDIIGFHSVMVTQEMVGKTVAVFGAFEIKTPKGVTSDEQKNFIAQVNGFGGIGFVARSEEEAAELFKKAGK